MRIFTIFAVITNINYANTNFKTPLARCSNIQTVDIGNPSCQGAFNFMKPHENFSLKDIPGEIWKDIPEWEGFYQVSNLGRIKSLKRVVPHTHTVYSTQKEKILKPASDRKGYKYICLYRNHISKIKKVHRLVLLAFKHDSPLTVNHINGVVDDNSLINLEYLSAIENSRAYRSLSRELPMGVYKYFNKYIAKIKRNNKNIHLGSFNKIPEAKSAYEKARTHEPTSPTIHSK